MILEARARNEASARGASLGDINAEHCVLVNSAHSCALPTRRAQPEIHRKRMRGLAVQTCNGLRSRYGLEVDASGVQSKLMDASRIRARVRAIEAQGSEAVSAAAAVHDSALADGTDAEAAVSRAMEALETARARRSALEAEAAAAPPPAKGKKPKKGAPAGPTEEEVAAARGEEEAARAALEAAEEEARPSREAVAAAEARVAAARAEADAAGAAAVSPEDEASIALLDAALGFRLPAALAALGLRDPRQHDTTLV